MSKEIHPTQQAYADGVKYGQELGSEAAYLKGFVEGKEATAQAERERILKMAEDTCSRNYHDSERVCDEHEVDDSQGNIWNANDLLSYLKQRLSGK